MKILTLLISILLLAVQLTFGQHVTNINTDLTYTTIQAAIDAPQTLNGHTLVASSGTFTDNITISKSVTLVGAGADSTILQTSNTSMNAVSIIANNVLIKRFTIRNATGSGVSGIRLQGVTGVRIDSCNITNNFRGIQLNSASNNTISNCNILSNIENGMVFFSSSNGNQIIDNTVANTIGGVGGWTGNGINTGDQSSSGTIIIDNTIHSNAHSSIIGYAGSNNMQIRGNTVNGNGYGIMLGWSNGCIIENNTISNNINVGMNFDTAPNNILRNNTVTSNSEGISMSGLGQTGNLIENNTISNNVNIGIGIYSNTRNSTIRFNTITGSSFGVWIGYNPGHPNYGNRIYNNTFIGNTTQAVDNSPEADYWDNSFPEGGNHWSNWTIPDTNDDGFVDSPYQIHGGYSQDNYPYVRQNGWIPTITTTTLLNGIVGQQYTDTLLAIGGIQPYAWSLIGGALPPGLTLTAQGNIHGIPNAIGAYNCSIQVRDARTPPLSSTRSFSISIIGLPQITTTSLRQAIAGSLYSDTLNAGGGSPPYKWSITAGILPPGVWLDSLSGVISGLPTTAETWQFTVRVTDDAEQTASREFSFQVNPTGTFSVQIALSEGYNPIVVFDGTRQNIYVVIEEFYGVQLYKSTDAGTTFQLVSRVDPTGAFSWCPSIAIDVNGTLGAVWLQSDPTAYNVYFRRSTDEGTTFGSPIRVNDAPASSLARPIITSYGNVFYITWRSDDNRIVLDKTIDGITFDTDVQVNTVGGSHGYPAMAVDEMGKIHIAWQRISVNHIWYANSTDTGRTFSQHQRVSTENLSYRPTIAVRSEYVYVAWDDVRNIYDDIYCAVSSNGGISFGSSVRVNDNTNNSTQDFACIALGSSRDVYAVWRDGRIDEMNQDIYFSRSTNAGQSFQTNQRVNSATGTPVYGHIRPAICVVGSTVFTVWSGTNGTGSTRYIYFSKASFTPGVPTVVEDKLKATPMGFALHQNYPNPFNPTTTISFALPNASFVSLRIFSLLGEEIATLVNQTVEAGTHQIEWVAQGVSSGVYFYRLVANAIPSGQAGSFIQTRKLVLLR